MLAIILQLAIIAGLVLALRLLLRGAPFLPSKPQAIREQVAFAGAVRGRRIAEIGSGDGRVAIALARAGATVDGYENNPLLVRRSRRAATAAGVADRVSFHRRDLWKVDYAGYDAVVVFGMSHLMRRLSRKLAREMAPGTVIVSNAFHIPGWVPVEEGTSALKYVVPDHDSRDRHPGQRP